jgi:hypothetical protein
LKKGFAQIQPTSTEAVSTLEHFIKVITFLTMCHKTGRSQTVVFYSFHIKNKEEVKSIFLVADAITGLHNEI